jgi:ABC-type dipeptide/oligopeptide/nickel transport system permease component
MPSYVARRLVFAIFVLWGAVTIIFLVVRLVPGDPALLMLGPDATAEQIASVRERLGLDRSIAAQYGEYVRNVLTLNFGESFRMRTGAIDLVASRAPASAELAVSALSLSLLIGVPLGVLAALKPHSRLDRVITTGSLATQSLPSFWIGIVFILVFARTFEVLPSSGNDSWQHLVLPSITLALPFLAILVRLVRSGLLEVVHEDYVRTARAKGFTERVVIFRHATRNALIPVVTIVGLQFAGLLSGTVIVETVFAWPGIGRLFIDSINNRDYAVVQACVFFIAAIFVLLNLFVDVLYGYLDPRVRITE